MNTFSFGYRCQLNGNLLTVHLYGDWRAAEKIPSLDAICNSFEAYTFDEVCFDSSELVAWNSLLLVFISQVKQLCNVKGRNLNFGSLPKGVCELVQLIKPSVVSPHSESSNDPVLERFGSWGISLFENAKQFMEFFGLTSISFLAFCFGRARFRRIDLVNLIYLSGPRAIPIISLISILVGLIVAYIGAIQLKQFGAEIYVANLVGLGMTRELGPVMAAVMMSGRTGAAFAAELASMKVNNEIDALVTMGISPLEFLVVPRIVALISVMPFLVIYADFVGIVGGALVGVGSLDIGLARYIDQTQQSVALADFFVGITKSVVFGVIIAMFGCYRGMKSEKTSDGVGRAATSAVVSSIVVIASVDAVFAIVLNLIGV